jgi:hypothetical protein
MKFVNVEESRQGHGRNVAIIHLNVNELNLLQSMSQHYSETLSKHGPTRRLQAVAKSMALEMKEAITVLEESGDKKSLLPYPLDNKAII